MTPLSLIDAAVALGVSRDRLLELGELGHIEMTSTAGGAAVIAESLEEYMRPSASALGPRGNRRRHGTRSSSPTRQTTTRRR